MVWDLVDPQPELSPREAYALKHSRSNSGRITTKRDSTSQPLLNCVYKKNCSDLYRAIEYEKWWDVAMYLDNGAWPVNTSCLPDFSPEDQALTVVTDLDNDANVLWSRLPLHLALLKGAHINVVGRLIDAAPQSLWIPDHKGNLPVHYAMLMHSTDEVLSYLLQKHPSSKYVTNAAGLTPLESALAAQKPISNARGKMLNIFASRGPLKLHSALKHQALVCDYENATPLYKKIQARDWSDVMHFLKYGTWPFSWLTDFVSWLTFKQSEEVHPQDQVMTAVTRKDKAGKACLADLPVHLAIVLEAPFAIVSRLTVIYPESLLIPDHRGMLPLHLALYCNSSDTVIAHLLESFPDSARIKGMSPQVDPVEIALKGDNAARGEVLKHFIVNSAPSHPVVTSSTMPKE